MSIAIRRSPSRVNQTDAPARKEPSAKPVKADAMTRAQIGQVPRSPISQRPERKVYVALSDVGLNDPVQDAVAGKRKGEIVITGIGTNRGTVGSSLVLDLAGHRFGVPVSRGDTPVMTAMKLKAALPKGFDADIVSAKTPGGPARIRIFQKA